MEKLTHALSDVLKSMPDTWAEYEADSLSSIQEKAMYLLTAAGMVEQRVRCRLKIVGNENALEAELTATGSYGLAEAMEHAVASLWQEWGDAWKVWKESESGEDCPFHCERLTPSEWRLTAEGLLALKDIESGEATRVCDFVLERGFFDGQPHLIDGRIIEGRPSVRGYGKLVRMEKVSSKPGTSSVSIANWGEGANALAAAFEMLLAQMKSDSKECSSGDAAQKSKPASLKAERRQQLMIEYLRSYYIAMVKGSVDEEYPELANRPLSYAELGRHFVHDRSTIKRDCDENPTLMEWFEKCRDFSKPVIQGRKRRKPKHHGSDRDD